MALILPGNLVGNYLIRVVRPAFHDAHKWLPKTKDRCELRRHSLKLRFWPEKHPEDENGKLLDLDWSWIQALRKKRIGELRVNDAIGGRDNLRIIFFDPDIREPMPMLWILSVLQKTRNDFTSAQIDNFDLRRTMVLERFYSHS